MTFNRRKFLATGAAATAAIGTPMILKAQAKEYVLGASLPLTGPFATAGQLVAPAFSLAQKLLMTKAVSRVFQSVLSQRTPVMFHRIHWLTTSVHWQLREIH